MDPDYLGKPFVRTKNSLAIKLGDICLTKAPSQPCGVSIFAHSLDRLPKLSPGIVAKSKISESALILIIGRMLSAAWISALD